MLGQRERLKGWRSSVLVAGRLENSVLVAGGRGLRAVSWCADVLMCWVGNRGRLTVEIGVRVKKGKGKGEGKGGLACISIATWPRKT